MEQEIKTKPIKKMGGGLKDRPQCERCGRPVRISTDDLFLDEILCPTCANELKTLESEDSESDQAWV